MESPQFYKCASVYTDLRNQVFSLTPEVVEPITEPPVLAVLMETGLSDMVGTLVCIADGSTSLYLSTGGGTIGAGGHESVARAAAEFVAEAARAPGLSSSQDCPLPQLGHTRFYVVTPTGIQSAEVLVDDFGHNMHPLSELFHKGNAVIAAVRQTSK